MGSLMHKCPSLFPSSSLPFLLLAALMLPRPQSHEWDDQLQCRAASLGILMVSRLPPQLWSVGCLFHRTGGHRACLLLLCWCLLCHDPVCTYFTFFFHFQILLVLIQISVSDPLQGVCYWQPLARVPIFMPFLSLLLLMLAVTNVVPPMVLWLGGSVAMPSSNCWDPNRE